MNRNIKLNNEQHKQHAAQNSTDNKHNSRKLHKTSNFTLTRYILSPKCHQ